MAPLMSMGGKGSSLRTDRILFVQLSRRMVQRATSVWDAQVLKSSLADRTFFCCLMQKAQKQDSPSSIPAPRNHSLVLEISFPLFAIPILKITLHMTKSTWPSTLRV